MQVSEILNSGLKREIKVVVPAQDMENRLVERLQDASTKVRLKGFRPGKVPLQHLRRMYGKSLMAEIVNEILSNSTRDIITERGEKAAMQPEVKMTEDEQEAEKILAGGADFEFSLSYEVIPAIELQDFSNIKITRQVYDVTDEEIDEQVKRVADSTRTYAEKDGAAENGDKVTLDYLGKLDGEPFEGGAAEDSDVVIGHGQFIPGFEEQLIGLKAGDKKTFKITFPESYAATHLAGKETEFDVTVKKVSAGEEIEINDALAEKLGLESAEKLREIIRSQLENQFGSVTRQKAKRQLLDALDAAYKFEAPSKLVEAEFNNIWTQVTRELEQAGRTFEDEDTTEEAAREEYQGLAERRVRLGLVLAQIGEEAGVQISEEEMQRALFDTIRRFPADQQQQVFEFYRQNPQALASVRAPLYEEKVVDHLLTKIDVTDNKVSREELLAEDEEETTEAAAKEKPAKKAPAKKKASKKAEEKAEEKASEE
ncbi:trigger factor [Nitratireductor aestuarii]|uniref:Trigger factor n=1 Tax=Nitratireductor aestuarii TaxID=1735103 RepID=A0A916W072_9HYPH|nr:trigger factor [Nitratireductor aestuarii]GGA55743.1 trigger factor [Nitratireductor aestuarii]